MPPARMASIKSFKSTAQARSCFSQITPLRTSTVGCPQSHTRTRSDFMHSAVSIPWHTPRAAIGSKP